MSKSNLEQVKKYIAGQEENHHKMSFQDELRALLRTHVTMIMSFSRPWNESTLAISMSAYSAEDSAPLRARYDTRYERCPS